MKILVWQWGRRGAGPRIAMLLADGFRAIGSCEVVLSLAAGAEILTGTDAPQCDLPVRTYGNVPDLLRRIVTVPGLVGALARRLREIRPDLAVCAMPGPLDLVMLWALRLTRVPIAVIVHDVEAHPGDGFPLLMPVLRALIRRADAVVVLSSHVAAQLRRRDLIAPGTPLIQASHPPLLLHTAPPPFAHSGRPRALFFGRLLAYKGLDLLVDALHRLGPDLDFEFRVIGQGPESGALSALRRLRGVAVQNRWVPEAELAGLIAWADLLVLPYTEASQSGVATAALGAGRFVLSTRVGGLIEQLGDEPLATLCEPDAASLATTLRHFITAPPAPQAAPARDAVGEWRAFACRVLDGVRRKPPH